MRFLGFRFMRREPVLVSPRLYNELYKPHNNIFPYSESEMQQLQILKTKSSLTTHNKFNLFNPETINSAKYCIENYNYAGFTHPELIAIFNNEHSLLIDITKSHYSFLGFSKTVKGLVPRP
jgi:hypothetical protein